MGHSQKPLRQHMLFILPVGGHPQKMQKRSAIPISFSTVPVYTELLFTIVISANADSKAIAPLC